MSTRQVYMDNNATTPLHPEVKKAIIEGIDIFGNASSLHSFGRRARKHIEKARKTVTSFIGAEPDELIFVGSGSEANNTVLNIFACKCPVCNSKKACTKEIITSVVEHPCILRTSECLIGKGLSVLYVGVDQFGKIDMELIKEMITDKTGLVSIMMANNEIGTIMDIKKIANMAHARGALFHTDAAQAVGKIPVNVVGLDVDFLTLSAHKTYGPKGIGALYIKKGTPFCPMIYGGHQERGRRAGTENTLGIVGLGKAVEMLTKEMAEDTAKILDLKLKLKAGIEESVPDIYFNGHPDDCLPGTLNVSFIGAEGESILLHLDLAGIAVSTGSACASGSLDPSHVLLATGTSAEKAHGSIRFSLGRENTKEDVDYVLEKLPGIIAGIRSISTAYDGRKK
ncbi:MAG: aminotransferase class V-fold PLP-dependent enzyme [Candidatus Omnitrophica bacterium]|nr:aminotransferase class V-fold PLP-dependent enzyme [Candidatus Omnitrophota bacterium]MBU1657227.1 aminotransferase class V-fold PLP-dependent enzyme [Candidatus Omnitrophota bacterium]MBU1785117.1 aminotransferase class V-fold PLP-dependent enzyme [Candidatus Omnitrophota bacterium]MBU1851510.1 aminotransferase class V-fold PLP-dependent enzyme [Candidatus Omnitrophota bacterium]